ncbi:MAG TPA: TIGR01777 family oxidoreductase [Acidimicrobiales bacterium]|nr:TIGR01777 family oxidoreductase [Acidimicrobiales bacterium]
MRIAVSGSRGFLGSSLVDALRMGGHEIHPIVRHNPRKGEIGIDFAHRSLDCSQIEGQSIGAVDIVYNLAGEPLTPGRWNSKKREEIRSSRISSTDLIARAIAKAPEAPNVLVNMSASGYYGNRGDEILTEQSAAGEGFLAELCRAWESATAPARAVGVRVVHARTGIVIGKEGGMLKAITPLFRLGLGGRLGGGFQWMSPISLVDEIRALVFVATNEEIHGPCNFTSPIPITNAEFTKALGSALHRPTLLHAPEFGLRMALGNRCTDEMVLASQRVIPARLQSTGFQFRLPSIDEALEAAR